MKRKILLSGAMALFLIAEPQITYGQEGASLNFDGIDDKVSLGTPLNGLLDGLNTFTVEAWVNPSTQTGLGCIIGNYNTTSANGQMQFLLRRDNDQYSFWVDAGSGFQWCSNECYNRCNGSQFCQYNQSDTYRCQFNE
jgi:hypothetical protein